MSDDKLLQRLLALENDNARLRHLLDERGSTAGRRHQTRNTLAMVRDIVRQSAHRFDGAENYAAHLEDRLDAVFRIQNTIASGPSDGVDLHALVMDEMLAHAVSEGAQLSVDGPDVLLQPAAAGTVGLAIHELASNAIEFGALSASTGHLAVGWTSAASADGEVWLTLGWVESGVPVIAPSSRRSGFGTQVVEQVLAYHLGGEGRMEFAPGGLRCTLRLPLSRWSAPPRVVPDDGVLDA